MRIGESPMGGRLVVVMEVERSWEAWGGRERRREREPAASPLHFPFPPFYSECNARLKVEKEKWG